MFYVSPILTTVPASFQTPLQEKTYQALTELAIPFERVETDEAITMEDCIQIDARLKMEMVKTLFLCNRQKTSFYLFITTGDKTFRSKDFSAAMGIARVSFAPVEMMESLLGTTIGAATVFSVLADSAKEVQLVFDKDVLAHDWYGCSDSTTTGYMKIKTTDIYQRLLPAVGRPYHQIEV